MMDICHPKFSWISCIELPFQEIITSKVNVVFFSLFTKDAGQGWFKAGVGKLFTRRARFGKTVEAAGRTLIGKQGEDLFIYLFVFFFGDHSPRTNVISKIKDFHLVFHFNFAPLRLIVLKITAICDL